MKRKRLFCPFAKCSQWFFDSWKLERHLELHSIDEHWNCDVCKLEFVNYDEYEEHCSGKKHQHKRKTTQQEMKIQATFVETDTQLELNQVTFYL
jgi:translation initiation factor IF-3